MACDPTPRESPRLWPLLNDRLSCQETARVLLAVDRHTFPACSINQNRELVIWRPRSLVRPRRRQALTGARSSSGRFRFRVPKDDLRYTRTVYLRTEYRASTMVINKVALSGCHGCQGCQCALRSSPASLDPAVITSARLARLRRLSAAVTELYRTLRGRVPHRGRRWPPRTHKRHPGSCIRARGACDFVSCAYPRLPRCRFQQLFCIRARSQRQ